MMFDGRFANVINTSPFLLLRIRSKLGDFSVPLYLRNLLVTVEGDEGEVTTMTPLHIGDANDST